VVAASSSIPTKYQTIVTDNSDRKGFNSRSKRFDSSVLVSKIFTLKKLYPYTHFANLYNQRLLSTYYPLSGLKRPLT